MTSLARRSSSQYAFPFFWVQTVFSLILSNRVRWSCAAVGFSSLCHYVYMSGSKHLDCLDLERRPRPSFLFCFFLMRLFLFHQPSKLYGNKTPLRLQPSLDGNTPTESQMSTLWTSRLRPDGVQTYVLWLVHCQECQVCKGVRLQGYKPLTVELEKLQQHLCSLCCYMFLYPDAVEYHFWPAWFKSGFDEVIKKTTFMYILQWIVGTIINEICTPSSPFGRDGSALTPGHLCATFFFFFAVVDGSSTLFLFMLLYI